MCFKLIPLNFKIRHLFKALDDLQIIIIVLRVRKQKKSNEVNLNCSKRNDAGLTPFDSNKSDEYDEISLSVGGEQIATSGPNPSSFGGEQSATSATNQISVSCEQIGRAHV